MQGLEVTSSRASKHGHESAAVLIDIFTGKKIEDLVPASRTTYAPFVKKMEYSSSTSATTASSPA